MQILVDIRQRHCAIFVLVLNFSNFTIPMKRTLALVCILLVAITMFACCDGSFGYTTIKGDGFWTPTTSPYQSQTIPNKNDKTLKVYVCGAVQNEGYYVVSQGTTIADVIALAGILTQTIFPTNSQSFVQSDMQIVVDYHQDGQNYNAVNANGAYTLSNLPAPNLPAQVVQKLHDYYVKYGKITNKDVLKQILGQQLYQQHHYKLYVAEADYEAIS